MEQPNVVCKVYFEYIASNLTSNLFTKKAWSVAAAHKDYKACQRSAFKFFLFKSRNKSSYKSATETPSVLVQNGEVFSLLIEVETDLDFSF